MVLLSGPKGSIPPDEYWPFGVSQGGVAITRDPKHIVQVSEMLPSPEQTWLTDAAGGPYTSEFRVAVIGCGFPGQSLSLHDKVKRQD